MKRFLQTRAWILCGPWPAEQREKGKVTFLGRVIVKGNVPPCPRRLQALLDPTQERSTSAEVLSSCSRGLCGLVCFICE